MATRSVVLGEDIADALAAAAYSENKPSIFVEQLTEVKLAIHRSILTPRILCRERLLSTTSMCRTCEMVGAFARLYVASELSVLLRGLSCTG